MEQQNESLLPCLLYDTQTMLTGDTDHLFTVDPRATVQHAIHTGKRWTHNSHWFAIYENLLMMLSLQQTTLAISPAVSSHTDLIRLLFTSSLLGKNPVVMTTKVGYSSFLHGDPQGFYLIHGAGKTLVVSLCLVMLGSMLTTRCWLHNSPPTMNTKRTAVNKIKVESPSIPLPTILLLALLLYKMKHKWNICYCHFYYAQRFSYPQ